MLWQQDCGFHGSCWEYDVTSLRFVYFGLAASLKFLGFLFIFLTWYSLKRREELTQTHTHAHTLSPLDTVSHLICHAGGHKGHGPQTLLSCLPATPGRHSHAAMPTGHALSRGNSCPGNGLKAITPPIRSLEKVAVWGLEPCTQTHTQTHTRSYTCMQTSYDYEGRLCKWEHTTPLIAIAGAFFF